jgi:uncharacterized protein (UPF0261 family)
MYLLTNLLNYLAIVVSATGATAVVSAVATVESTATAVESVATSVEALPPHATKAVIAKIAITFFIFVLFFVLNYTN